MAVRKRIWTTRRSEQREAWVVDYTDHTGKRRFETFTRKGDADSRAAKIKVELGKGTHVALDSKATVADVAENWIRRLEAEGRERSTLAQYRQHLKLHILPHLGRVRLAKLTPERIEAYRDLCLLEKESNNREAMSRAMARKVLVSLKSLLKSAKCGHLADGIRISLDERGKRKLEIGCDVPENAEIKRLFAATAGQPRKRALLLMAAFTGLRASELRGLRWYDVDLKAGELHVRQRADRYNAIGSPKSKKSRRTIPLDPGRLVPALKEWKLACPKSELDLVFPTRTGAIDTHKNMLRSLEPIMRAAGVMHRNGKPKYALHAFRHYFASWCISPKERGGRELPAKVVQEWLGHSTIAMTLDVYGHLFKDVDRNEVEKSVELVLG
jgi:integrase